MKKRIFAILLSALLMASATACNYAPDNIPENETESAVESTVKSTMDHTETTIELASFETYESTVSTYRRIVEVCSKYEEVTNGEYFTFADETAYNLYTKIFNSTLLLYPTDVNGINGDCYERFGYTVKDLNNDGVDELILRLDNHEVIAIFTMVDDTPVLLDCYWNRKNCWIDPDGYLHIGGSSGADRSILQIYRIADKTGELILLEEGGTDGHDEASGNTLYYKLVNNEKTYITQAKYHEWMQSLPYAKIAVTTNISEYLPFVPLFDENHPAPEPCAPQTKG